jgi:flagellar L-ring protein precursor FlgH
MKDTGRFSRRIPALVALGLAMIASPACLIQNTVKTHEEQLTDDLVRAHELDGRQTSPVSTKGSLWNQTAQLGLAADTKACKAGDLVTVKVVEETKGSQQATTDLNKDGKLQLAAPTLAGWEKTLMEKNPNLDMSNIINTTTQKAFKGDGATTRQTSVIGSVTARVIGVYPNGDLAVVGNKDVDVNHERQVLTIAGIVRPEDLASDNTVTTDRLAELYVHLGGRGDINDQQREGWLSRLIQKVWPF